MSVTVVGSANVDVVSRVARIPAPGETVLAASVARVCGGKGSNQALAAARSGASTTFVCALGDDDSASVVRAPHEEAGVGLRARVTELPTGTAYISVDDAGENAIVVDPGANAALLDLTAEETASVTDARVLLTQLETPLATVRDAQLAAQLHGVVTVLNASPVVPGVESVLPDADVVVVNEHEAVQVAGALGLSAASTEEACRAIAARGHVVVATLGGRGALLVMPDGAIAQVPAHRVEVVDTTGAGDTWSGAFVAALDESLASSPWPLTPGPLTAAMRWAAAAAACAVQTAGAEPSIPTRARIAALADGAGAGGADGVIDGGGQPVRTESVQQRGTAVSSTSANAIVTRR